MQKTLAAIALTSSIIAAAGPALAIGPAGLAQDLMYTSAIGRSPEIPLTTRVGFVRPSVPFVLRSPAAIEGEGYRLKAYSKTVTFAIDYVFAKTIGTVEALAFLR
ncbi:hypothetical protein NXC14_CH03468 [Rhizobium sp. NXC14]|uniref:hypothetical protein n=1 Tax=Rhizobium sp. NXC14 TaxID=1981173 RepID=UPI000A204795|nr:hypothetical protein [Rhizobium sp. NXC14]ARO31368.1 hypothetical protein NXC14_CH03468 [Rhizobium sp. NXC14]